MTRFWSLALLFVAGCVSVEEAPLQPAAIAREQRTVLLAYQAPGPFVLELDSKAESAAKVVPGLALAVQAAQDERDLAASKDLQMYVPRFDAAAAVLKTAAPAFAKTAHPGKWVTPEQAELSTGTLKALNAAPDVVEWKRLYYDPSPRPGRDYARLLSLDDALILELNIAPGVATDGEGGASPAVWGVAKLYRANSMRQLWRHEEVMQDDSKKRLLYDFKVKPQDLTDAWKELAPKLADQLAASYAQALAGVPSGAGSSPAGAAPMGGGLPPTSGMPNTSGQPGTSPFGGVNQTQPGLSPVPH